MIVLVILALAAGATNPTTASRTVPAPTFVRGGPANTAHDADLRKSMALGCRDGEQSFCFQLGLMLKAGAGGPANPADARRLFHDACRHGLAIACREDAR